MHIESRQLNNLTPLGREPGLSEADLIQFCSDILPREPIFDLLVNEARFALSRVAPILASLDVENPSVIEVGAGSCILSAYLASKGLHMTALEPLGPEFDFLADAQCRVLDFCQRNGIRLTVIRATGEQLDSPGQFDFAFTINALEHMREPLLAIDNMYRSLKPGGFVFATCPNYTIPFEVHFNIFLVTRSKRLNEWLYRSKISRYPRVWDELNFIRYIDVRRHLARRGLEFTFNHAAMRNRVARLLHDPIFAQRMPRLVRAIGAGMTYCGLLNALAWIPSRFQTPMEVLIKRADRALD